MYEQLHLVAVETRYGEDAYNTGVYASTTQQSDDLLANTGQDVMLFAGLGLIMIAVSLFALLRRKKQNKSSKIG